MAAVVYAVVLLAVSTLWVIFHHIFTVVRPGILIWMGSMIGTAAGVFAAKGACKAWLPAYNSQIIFFLFAAVFALAILGAITTQAFSLVLVGRIIQGGLTIVLAYSSFWLDE